MAERDAEDLPDGKKISPLSHSKIFCRAIGYFQMLALKISVLSDVSVLRTTIQDLRRREKQLLKYKEQSEIEFGQRRAKFKELYLAREGE